MAKLDILSLAYVNNGIISVSINRSHFSSKFGKDNCPYMFRRTCSLKYFLSDKLLFFNKKLTTLATFIIEFMIPIII